MTHPKAAWFFPKWNPCLLSTQQLVTPKYAYFAKCWIIMTHKKYIFLPQSCKTQLFLPCVMQDEMVLDLLHPLVNQGCLSGVEAGNVTPIFQKGWKDDHGSYRPTNLTSLPGKVIEWIISRAITDHFKVNQEIRSSQHGFMLLLDKLDTVLWQGDPFSGLKVKLSVWSTWTGLQ